MQDHQIPRRRVPMLAGERAGSVIGSPTIRLLTAETGPETALWLEGATLELQRLQILPTEERLIAVAADLSYGKTNTGKLVAL